jgi:SAM-dependent methyltransferase
MPTPTLEYVRCPLCGGDSPTPLMRGPDRVHGVPGTFVVVRCGACGLAYQNPRPTPASFAAIYPANYGPYQGGAVDRAHLHPDLAMACRFVHAEQPAGGRLLDIGCGPGLFLQAMRLLYPQWHVSGVEPDAAAAAAARRAGLDVQHSTVEQADLAPHSWDAVTLWNVIEHLPDPVGMLRRARQLLRPGGVLYMAVPLRDSWDARLFGRYWIGWELPRHFTLFDRPTLARLLDSAGFRLAASACINGRSYGCIASLRLLIEYRVRAVTRRRLGQAITYSRPLALALAPYTAAAVLARRCTVLSVAARLPGPGASGIISDAQQ